ncbi:MAG: hypothetical protein WCF17_19615 [Terracidiphilus sp.]
MRSLVVVLLVLASSFAYAAKRVTVQELTQILASMHQSNKTDDDVATRLKQVQLGEELTAADRATLEQYLPGPESKEQLDILAGLSAFLPPAASPSPAPAIPDTGATLSRAQQWIKGTYLPVPTYTASKVVLRYQDDVQNTSSQPGLQVDSPNTYTKLAEGRTDTVETAQGVEKLVGDQAKAHWGENGQISEGGPIPPLPDILEEAAQSEKVAFSRWATMDGKPAAVFTFAVDKKKSRYSVNYCCFPQTDTATGVANSGVMLAPGDIQSVTTWHPFKKTVSYHGLLFIDPGTGAILRTITFADLKPSDFVHTEEVRVDYTSTALGDKICVVPQSSITVDEVVPGGDAGAHGYSVRHRLFLATYGNYKPGAAQ